MKKILLLISSLLFNNYSFAQPNDCGNNAGFELGTTVGWVCKYGGYGYGPCPADTGTVCPAFATVINNYGCLNNSGNNAPLNTGVDRHTVVNNFFNDTISGYHVIPVGGGNYAFRLGDAVGGGTGTCPSCYARAEAIDLTFLVTPNNASFSYRYSAVIEDTIHAPEGAPRFEVIIKDSAGNLLPHGNYLVIGNDSNANCIGLDAAKWHKGTGLWRYTDWTAVGLDLSSYIGTSLTVEFRTSDCLEKDTGTCNYYPGNHSAYVYIDAYCFPYSKVNEVNRNKQSFNIYPNPLTSSSILQLNTQVKNAEVVIYDMLGKEMVRKKMDGDRMEIEKGSLESGFYFVRVRSEERQWVGKIAVE